MRVREYLHRGMGIASCGFAVRLRPLVYDDLLLLQHWLNEPHVAAWYDAAVKWTREAVEQKYAARIAGWMKVDGLNKPICASIMMVGHIPVGYLQVYDQADVVGGEHGVIAGVDLFVGAERLLRKGVARAALSIVYAALLRSEYLYVQAAVDTCNHASVALFKKEGFTVVWQDWLWYAFARGTVRMRRKLTKMDGIDDCEHDQIVKGADGQVHLKGWF